MFGIFLVIVHDFLKIHLVMITNFSLCADAATWVDSACLLDVRIRQHIKKNKGPQINGGGYNGLD